MRFIRHLFLILALFALTGCGEIFKQIWWKSQGREVPEDFGGEKPAVVCPTVQIAPGMRSLLRASQPGESYRVDIAGAKTACDKLGSDTLTQIKIKFRVLAGPGNTTQLAEIRYFVSASDGDGKNQTKKFYTSYFPVREAGKPYETVEIIEHNVITRQKKFLLSVGIEQDPKRPQPGQAQTVQQQTIRAVTIAPVQQETLPGTENLIWR